MQAFFGALLAGGVPVPIYPPARLSQLEDHLRRHARILDNARARHLVTFRPALAVSRLLSRPRSKRIARGSGRGRAAARFSSSSGSGRRRSDRRGAAAIHLRQHRQPQGRRSHPREPAGKSGFDAPGSGDRRRRHLRELAAALSRHGADWRVARQPLLRDAPGADVAALLSRPAGALARGHPPLPCDPVGRAELRLRDVPAAHLGCGARRPRSRVLARRVQRRRAGKPRNAGRLRDAIRAPGLRSQEPSLRCTGSRKLRSESPSRRSVAARATTGWSGSRWSENGCREGGRGVRRRGPEIRGKRLSRFRASKCAPSTTAEGRRRSAGWGESSFAVRPPLRATSATPRPPGSSSTATGSSPGTSATSRAARALHHRSRQGPHHPGRGATSIPTSSNRRRARSRACGGAAWRCSDARTGSPAPSGWWWSPKPGRRARRRVRRSPAAIEDAAIRHLGSPPDEVRLVPPYTVRKTSSGKIRRHAVRELFEQERLGAGSTACAPPCSSCVWVAVRCSPSSGARRGAGSRRPMPAGSGWRSGLWRWWRGPVAALGRSPRQARALLRRLARALLMLTGLRLRTRRRHRRQGRDREGCSSSTTRVTWTDSFSARRSIRFPATWSRASCAGSRSAVSSLPASAACSWSASSALRSTEDARAITAALEEGAEIGHIRRGNSAPHARIAPLSTRRLFAPRSKRTRRCCRWCCGARVRCCATSPGFQRPRDRSGAGRRSNRSGAPLTPGSRSGSARCGCATPPGT